MDTEWLREGLRLSLKASIYTVAHNGNDQPPERDPRLRKLIERILFSRKLILTYHVVILCFVLVLSIIHWTSLLIRLKRKSASRLFAEDACDGDVESTQPASKPGNEQDMKGISSSGSSSKIPGDDCSLGKDDENEETPLLRPSLKRLPQNIIICRIRALLMYQPRPIPIVNRLLPSNGTSTIVIAFLVLNLFYVFYDIHLVYCDFIVLADRFGLVFSANIPLLYLLAAKNQPLKLLTGRSYESMNIFHRRLGELLCLEGFLHALGFLLAWYALFKPAGFGLVRFLLLKRNLIGTGMLLAYELLYITSLDSFRRRWYELFLGLHVVFQILALLGLYFHHTTGQPYALAALVIFILDRIVYRTRLKSITISAQTKILEDEETVKLTSAIVLQPRSAFLGLNRSIGSGWQAADHVFITVPSLSRKHIFQAHPFTIASAPPQLGASEAHLELLIRAQDGFSRDLLNAARLHKELQIHIDGPYGSSHARTMLEDSGLALLVAGGSGIAVSWPLIQHLLAKSCSSDMERATTKSPCRQKIVLIWVVHETAHLSWLGREALAAAEDLGAEIIIPRATEEIGRPDLKGMLRNIVDSYAGKEKKTSVVASGPDGMGRLVRNTCAELVWEGRDVRVAVEKFGW
ncbi:ferric reductase transmembrane component [Diplocarpon rosae]|nr:ferric reductase transmembrane component [Diplocarpon rosae]